MNEKPQGERWCTMPHDPWCPQCKRQRDTLLSALREIATKTRYGCCAPIYPDSPICSHNIARAAISEVEGEKT